MIEGPLERAKWEDDRGEQERDQPRQQEQGNAQLDEVDSRSAWLATANAAPTGGMD